MRTYRKVKTIDNYRCEDYLHQVTNIRHRNIMTKLRLSNHRLAIETVRYIRPYKKPIERICPLGRKEAEDEKHFSVVSCPVYQEKRKSLFECLYKEFKILIVKMSTENIFLYRFFCLISQQLCICFATIFCKSTLLLGRLIVVEIYFRQTFSQLGF